MGILFYIFFYICLNFIAYNLFMELDFIAKVKIYKLKKLNKFKFLFARNKIIKELKDKIGILSFKLQIVHLILTIFIFLVLVINLFLKVKIIYLITNFVLFIYLALIVILLFKYYKDYTNCKQMLIDRMLEEINKNDKDVKTQNN